MIFRKRHSISLARLVLFVIVSSKAGAANEEGSSRSNEAHFELAPQIQAILAIGDAKSKMATDYIKYATNLVNNVDALDESVATDVKLHDIEQLGFAGLAGLKNFRRERNTAFSYDRAIITEMRFPEPEIIEVDVCTERTDTITGAKLAIVINARNRWTDGKLQERWDGITQLPPGSHCEPVMVK